MKTMIGALGILLLAGAPAIFAATRATPATQQAETIVCPLTGEEIEPCCCPLGGEQK